MELKNKGWGLIEYKVTIKEFHVDSYGHVNNATYLALFEEARWELITQRGFGYNEIHHQKKGPIVLEVNLKFRREIALREDIVITTEVLKYEGKIGQMRQQVLKSAGVLACDAIFTFGLFDMKERKLISPTPDWKKALGLSY